MSNQRATARFESSPSGDASQGAPVALAWVCSRTGDQHDVQPSWSEFTGQSADDSRGSGWLAAIYPDDREIVRSLFATGRPAFTEGAIRMRHCEGNWRWLRLQLLENPASLDPAGDWLVLGIDITGLRRADLERRWLLAAAKDARIEAEQANRAKSEFVANMSHELRTPLNSIIGFAEILKTGMVGTLEPQHQRFVEDICSASKHLHSLINDVLDLAKVEAGKYVLELGECRVVDLLQAAAFVLRESSIRRDIRFEVVADPALGTACLDPRKMKQVLFNLLSNAVKFSPDQSTVRLKAWCCTRKDVCVSHRVPSRILPLPDADADDFIAFAVEDDGAGIPADQMDTLFTPFGQLKGVKSHDGEGTGLGLSLVGRLVQLHGGTVGIESEVGSGTRFLAWIPRRATPPDCLPTRGPAPDLRARA